MGNERRAHHPRATTVTLVVQLRLGLLRGRSDVGSPKRRGDLLPDVEISELERYGLVRQQIEISGNRSVEVLWFNGIDMGYSSEVSYFPSNRTVVALVSNIGGTQFTELRKTLAEVLAPD